MCLFLHLCVFVSFSVFVLLTLHLACIDFVWMCIWLCVLFSSALFYLTLRAFVSDCVCSFASNFVCVCFPSLFFCVPPLHACVSDYVCITVCLSLYGCVCVCEFLCKFAFVFVCVCLCVFFYVFWLLPSYLLV